MDSDDDILPEARIFNRRANFIIQSKEEAYEKLFTKMQEEKVAETVENEQNDMLNKIKEKLKKKPKGRKAKTAKKETVEKEKLQPRTTRQGTKRGAPNEDLWNELEKEDTKTKVPSLTPVKLPALAKRRLKELELQTKREAKRVDEETEKILSSCNPETLKDLPDSTPSPVAVEQDISLRFRYMSDIDKLSINENEKFSTIFPKVADLFQLKASEILLCIGDRNIQIDDSPHSLKLKYYDMIDCFPYKAVDPSREEQNVNNLLIRIQSSDSRKKVEMHTHKLEKFQDIMSRYATLRDIPLKDLSFQFDGEDIESNQTPEDLDMESGSCVDVKVSSQPQKKSLPPAQAAPAVVDLSDDDWQPLPSNQMLQICMLDSD